MTTSRVATSSRAHCKRGLLALITGFFAWALVFAAGLKLGNAGDVDIELIAQLRLPREVLATAIGMGLAVAGAVLQALFTNPLCEPYTLGISSGAALGAVIGAWLGIPLIFSGLTGSAFLGAIGFSTLLFLISLRRPDGKFVLLLAGVMLGFLGSSLVAVFMALSDPNGIQGALFWLLGDLSRARPQGAVASLGVVLILVTLIWTRWRGLDALLVGEENARALGVSVSSVRSQLLFLSSLLIGVCVSGGGMIGFVGLVIPHLARQQVGSLHRRMIPVAAIWGAFSLTLADALTRSLARPYELPVGVVTALIGAPIFLWILLQRRQNT